MIIIETEQGTAEWLSLRAGLPTASNFDKIVTSKGEPSKSAKKYLYQLAGERLTGTPMDTYQSAAMERGKEIEAEAREAYAFLTDNEVLPVGFCFRDERRRYGCSPDGLIGADGGLEIKCPTLPVAVEYLDNGKLPTEYVQQVQGSMFITGRTWWDFLSYFPGLPPLLIRVERDESFLRALDAELRAFCDRLDNLTERLRK